MNGLLVLRDFGCCITRPGPELRYNPTLKAFGDRLAATGMAPKAVVGAVMRKLAHLVYGIITSGKPFDENHQAGLAIQDGI